MRGKLIIDVQMKIFFLSSKFDKNALVSFQFQKSNNDL